MYRIVCYDGTVLYDSSNPDNYMATEPTCTLELGQPGSLSFSLLPEHPAYNLVKTMETYLSAYRDSEEIFYGRVVDVKTSKITGLKQIECAGALSFLDDGELPPLAQDGETMTASAFMQRCITAYNNDIGTDSKRNMSFGTASYSRAGTSSFYQINNHTKVKSAIESYCTNKYGGFLRFRRSGGTMYVDWVDTTTQVDPSPITLATNVIDQENTIGTNDFVTRIRPIGKDRLALPEGTIEVRSGMISKYGRITRTANFSDADTVEKLRSEAQQYVSVMPKGLGGLSEIKCLDMHYMDGSKPYIAIGVGYTNIAGFEGETLCVAHLELNFTNPANDSVTLKNERELNVTSYQSSSKPAKNTGRGGRGGGGGGGASAGFQNTWQHITETETTLTFHADLISSHAQRIEETADEFERYAQSNTAAVERIQGTGVFQNSDLITQVAGNYSVNYYLVSASALVGKSPKSCGYYEGPTEITATEEMVNSGIEVFEHSPNGFNYMSPGPGGKIPCIRVPSDQIVAGTQYYQVTRTNDETAQSGKNYYSRGLVVHSGAEFRVEEDGFEQNIWSEIKDADGKAQSVLDSALWVKRNDITGAVGEMEIVEDPETGERTLVVKSGGGIKIRRDNTEFGIYDSGTLTGGIIVDKINDSQTLTKINGTRVDVEAGQVRVGDTTNVADWMRDTGGSIDNLSGLIADRATIASLNALAARVSTIEADYITTDLLNSNVTITGSLSAGSIITPTATLSTASITTGSIYTFDCHNLSINGSGYISDFLVSASKSSDGKTLTLTYAGGSTVTFSKAATASLSGSWSGRSFVVTASPSDSAVPNIVAGSVYDGIVPVSGTSGYDSSTGNVYQDFIIYADDEGDAGQQIMRKTLTISGNAAYEAGLADGEGNFSLATVTLQGSVSSRKPVNTSSVIAINPNYSNLYEVGTATVTGRGTSYTCREVVDSGGLVYYLPGTETTYYNAGTTTVVGRGDSVTAREVVSSGGTAYYLAGSSTKYYNAGTTTVVGRGDSVTAREVLSSGGTLYYTTSTGIQVRSYGSYAMYYKSGESYVPAVGGTRTWYYADSGGTQYYNRANGTRFGSSATYYKGNGGTKTVQGGEVYVTPISGSAVRLGNSDTYYKGNGGTYTVQGSSVSVTPIGEGSVRLGTQKTAWTGDGGTYTVQGSGPVMAFKRDSEGTLYYTADNSATLYNAGTTDTTHYYTKDT